MAIINDLVAQIEDKALRERIEAELERVTKQKKFGLVFEDHLPECTPLYDIPVKVGSTVARRAGQVNEIYKVLKIEGEEASCVKKDDSEVVTFAVNDLVSVAEFGEAIYPYLKPLDSVCNAPDSDLWHTLIEADNYHALQLLEYLYAGKVDCIYIDPPYNTGAKDWKYNNDYVDGADSYRHSKWLSFMEKRLKIAKKLLNPKDSALIVTIDEKEYLHLGCLLEEIFPEGRMQMISSIIKPEGTNRRNEFSRTNEFIFIVMLGEVEITPSTSNMFEIDEKEEDVDAQREIEWRDLRRRGAAAKRSARPNQFYPVFIDKETGYIHSIGNALKPLESREEIVTPDGCYAFFPLSPEGVETMWSKHYVTAQQMLIDGYIKAENGTNPQKVKIRYLPEGIVDDIKNGKIILTGRGNQGEVEGYYQSNEKLKMPKTLWYVPSHNAQTCGSLINKKIFTDNRFDFPKSLYAVRDTIRFFVANKPNALVLDFFAGSGTTLHAVNLLNAEDSGHRRCIVVTNNEVSAEEAVALSTKGYRPGDDAWNALGIARYVTWPRTVCSIKGCDVNGNPLKGNYVGLDRLMSEGFLSNACFFKLGFLDRNAVELGRQFKELIPVLWMKAGAIGECPVYEEENPGMLVLPKNKFAVLADERMFMEFIEELDKYPEIETVYIVTNSDRAYRDVIAFMDGKNTYQLYRDYLDNFRINTVRR